MPGPGWTRILLRAALPPGDEARRPPAPTTGRAYDAEPARPTGEPGRRGIPVARGESAGVARPAGRGAGPARHPAGVRRLWPRRAGRSQPVGADVVPPGAARLRDRRRVDR